MVSDNLIPINLVIGDRTYRIKIDPKDEETVRRTIGIVNDKIIEYKTNFAGKDMQDYIAMVLIWLATDSGQESRQLLDSQDLVQQVRSIENLLKKV